MSTTIQQIQQDVSDETDVVNSAVALLNGLGTQLKAAIDAAKQSAGDFSALDDLHNKITTNKQNLAAAVAANTQASATAPTTTDPSQPTTPAPTDPTQAQTPAS